MSINLATETRAPFRIKRPSLTTNGLSTEIDSTVKNLLTELNSLLGKRVFPQPEWPKEEAHFAAEKPKAAAEAANAPRGNGHAPSAEVKRLLQRSLTPKRVNVVGPKAWADGSLAETLAELPEDPKKLTLEEYIDATSDLSTLKYAFESSLSAHWFNLDFNAKAILGESFPAIRNYLLAYAVIVGKAPTVDSLRNYILTNLNGVRNFANYAVLSAARILIEQEQLNAPGAGDDNAKQGLNAALLAAELSLAKSTFAPGAKAAIDEFIFNADELKIIKSANLGVLPPDMTARLVKFIQASRDTSVPITALNAQTFLPAFVSQLIAGTFASEVGRVPLTEDIFAIEELPVDETEIQISRSAVLCAAQLYYCMILGDELEIFGVVQHFTHKYLVRGGIEILDARLREDLQLYVFSNRFVDARTSQIVDRTRAEERRMFYGQVFAARQERSPVDMPINDEFPNHWRVLILEAAKYIERAQSSLNPDIYVSRQNVMQAVEDLQYNLSTHCTGMANVITPLIHAELNFVLQRILFHPEIRRQVAPSGGSRWAVVEALYLDWKKTRPRATVLFNKAKLGSDILREIAGYNPVPFEQDGPFLSFISKVEAFITTQSILQEALTDQLKRRRSDMTPLSGKVEGEPEEPHEEMPPPALAGGGNSGGSEWDF